MSFDFEQGGLGGGGNYRSKECGVFNNPRNAAETRLSGKGKASRVIKNENGSVPVPTLSVVTSKQKQKQMSPDIFANDFEYASQLQNDEANLFNSISTPTATDKRNKRKNGCDADYLSMALEAQTDANSHKPKMGAYGRVKNQPTSNEPSSQSNATCYDPNPFVVSEKPVESLRLFKHNNKEAKKNYTKVIAGSAIQQQTRKEYVRNTKEDDDEIEDSDDNQKKGKWSSQQKKGNETQIYDKRGCKQYSTYDKKQESYGPTKQSFGNGTSAGRKRPLDKKHDSSRYSSSIFGFSDDESVHYPMAPKKRTGGQKHSDDDEYLPSHKRDWEKTKDGKSPGVNPDSFHKQSIVKIRRSPRIRSPLVKIGNQGAQNVIELMDSDDDSVRIVSACENNKRESETLSQPQMGETMKVEAARIAIGSKVFRMHCKLSFQPGGKKQYISLHFAKDIANTPSVEMFELRFFLEDDGSVSELKFFIPDDELDENRVSPDDAMSFLAMRITPTQSNRLIEYTNHYLFDAQLSDDNVSDKRRFIVVEFRKNDEFFKLLQAMKKNPILANMLNKNADVSYSDIKLYSGALITDNRRDRASRIKSLSRHEPTNKVLLVYPFNGLEDVIEEAAQGLNEARVQIGKERGVSVQATTNIEASDSQEKPIRAHYLTIRDEDRLRLTNDEFLNDTLVDFWMQWISRFERKRSSPMHFFTSHFFTTLVKEGPEGVSSWTSKKYINIFEKKFIFIPINESLHWSLCVVVNPGKIFNYWREGKAIEVDDDDDEIPCILFFDSLKAHRKQKVGRRVREWLNFESTRLGYVADCPEPFNDETMELHDPKIPYQENSWDCGVFVCRYAFGLMQEVGRLFTRRAARDKFLSLITRSVSFKFSGDDISRIRREINRLIIELSKIFLAFKAEESEKVHTNDEQTNVQKEEARETTVPASSDE